MFEVLCAVIAITIVGLAWRVWQPIFKWSGIAIAVLVGIAVIVSAGRESYSWVESKWWKEASAVASGSIVTKNISQHRLELLFEAERRGILEQRRLDAIQELRRRGVVASLAPEGPSYYRLLNDTDLRAALKESEAGPWKKYQTGNTADGSATHK